MKNFKKKMNITIAAVVACTVLTVTVSAASLYKDIRVQIGGVQVLVKGKQLNMKDTSGATIEPIIYNGTTYLPVRAVAESVGLKATWDGATSTISLGGENVTYLDELPATNFESTHTGVSKYQSLGKTQIYKGSTYTRALSVITGIPYGEENEGVTERTTLDYTLDGTFKQFLASIDVNDEYFFEPTIIRIYGDGAILYTSPGIIKDSQAYNIDINVTGVRKLTFEFESIGLSNWTCGNNRNLIFGEARLVK